MKSIALIHTVKTVANSFDQTLKDYVGEPVKVHNLWDDFLANNPNEIGEFTIENRCRLYNDIKSAEMTGADMIVVTCSTLTPVVNMIRPFIKVPLIAIDDAMGRKAVTYGDRILVLATAGSTEVPMREKLNAEAEKLGKTVTPVDGLADGAYQALVDGKPELHDECIAKTVMALAEKVDCILLAQGSMARMEQKLGQMVSIPVYASPQLCLNAIRDEYDKE